MQSQFFIASELGVPLSVVREMSVEEMFGWVEWFSFRAKEERKAMDKAKKGHRGR